MSGILEMVERRGIRMRKASMNKGGEYHGACPGCGGDDRFHVWTEQNEGHGSYWCRQCGKAGDAIQFLIDFDGLSFREAAERMGRPLEERHAPRPPAPERRTFDPPAYELPGEQWRAHALAFVTGCYETLCNDARAMEWLAGRGIRPENAARFGLGWNAGENGKDLFRDRESWGLSRELREDGRRKALWLPRGLVIPLFRARDVWRVRIRRDPATDGPKYYAVPGSVGATWTHMPPTGHARMWVVVESELDGVLLAQDAPPEWGVAALGSASARPDEAAARKLAKAACVLVALDADAAGVGAMRWWRDTFANSRPWPVPKGKDPGEAFQAGVNLPAWMTAGLPEGLRRGRGEGKGKVEG